MSRRANKRQRARNPNFGNRGIQAIDAALYTGTDAAEKFLAEADEESLARLQKVQSQDEDGKKRWLNKTMTRRDTIELMSIWQQRFLLPMGAKIDALENYIEYLERPFYERWWLRGKAWAIWLILKLRRKIGGLSPVDASEGGSGSNGAEADESQRHAPEDDGKVVDIQHSLRR